jgi:1-acyl-sn-glycerol-3-phosphate acyltransferase
VPLVDYATRCNPNFPLTDADVWRRWRKFGVVLLWAAVGLDLIISKLGYPLVGQCVSIVCVLLYLFENISLRKAMCSFWFGMMDLYFREISIGGQHKILPINDGRAVIFACAPHVNQFVDPIVVMKVVAEKTRRHVSWMTAAKSFHRKDIGGIARAIKAIPVVRPEDNETKGSGFITAVGKKVVGSGGSQFTQELAKGSVLIIKHADYGKLTGKVMEVLSDTELVLAGPMQGTKTLAKTLGDGECKSFNRAMSVRTTALLLVAILLPLAYALPPYFPTHWWPLVYMISFQLACGITNFVYVIYREEHPELEDIKVTALSALEKLVGGGQQKDGDAPARDSTLPRNNSRDTMPRTGSRETLKRSGSRIFDHNVQQSAVDMPPAKVARDIEEPCSFSFLPYVDQSEMFENVYEHLSRGGTIGIFPEGGTHDGTKLLPLKWGISTMVLGAMAKYRHLKISVVPVGLNYFSPHKFRSTVSVDFGDPIEIDQGIADLWLNGCKEEKQDANQAVMELVVAGMSAVTLQAKDVQTLELYRTVRRLYLPLGTRLSVADNVALTQSVAAGFRNVKVGRNTLACFHARTHAQNHTHKQGGGGVVVYVVLYVGCVWACRVCRGWIWCGLGFRV